MRIRSGATSKLVVGACLGLTWAAAAAPSPAREATPPRTIEIALCLDTSNSMAPLIDAARVGLWDIVNDLARLEPAPVLRVALIGYGGSAEDPRQGWVTLRAPLGADLDAVSEQLFALTTGGGTEYVGRALATAVERLDWSPPGPDTLQLLFLAGNEETDQDPATDALASGRAADERGLELFAIYCGHAEDVQAEGWRALAEAARGRFATLDLSTGAGLAATPVDRELARLGQALSATCVELADAAPAGSETVAAQDRKVASLSPAAAAARAETKAGALYRPAWDVVDAVASGRLSLDEIELARLPQALRRLAPAERQAWVERTLGERRQLRQRIRTLAAQRQAWLADRAARPGPGGERSFERLVREAIRAELEERGWLPAGD